MRSVTSQRTTHDRRALGGKEGSRSDAEEVCHPWQHQEQRQWKTGKHQDIYEYPRWGRPVMDWQRAHG
ncbi:MAG TPA: hypothetical protein VFZ66_08050 [Herpetosiphonaceae bacterium]